jgi:hypothetical protein
MPVLCPGTVAIDFIDWDGNDAGFQLPCNDVLVADPETGVAVCHNGHQWPAKEAADAVGS